jgi:hypothetical protein
MYMIFVHILSSRVFLTSPNLKLEARANAADTDIKPFFVKLKLDKYPRSSDRFSSHKFLMQHGLMETAIEEQGRQRNHTFAHPSFHRAHFRKPNEGLQILVELKRLEQLKAIASSQSNST